MANLKLFMVEIVGVRRSRASEIPERSVSSKQSSEWNKVSS